MSKKGVGESTYGAFTLGPSHMKHIKRIQVVGLGARVSLRLRTSARAAHTL